MEEETDITILGSFQKNVREAVCTGVNEWRGNDYFFIRVFVPTLNSEDLIPTREGVSLTFNYIDDFYDGVKKLGEIMGCDQVVKCIEKEPDQQVRIGYNLYKDIPLLYIRIFRKFGSSNEYSATKQGVSIRTEQYPFLLDAVSKLYDYVKETENKNKSN